jgi:hypothetical protein
MKWREKMGRNLLVVGLGGFGKWVVTNFKSRILDTYGEKPDNIDWLSADLIGAEDPLPKYVRFELGKLKEEVLDYSNRSSEFVFFGGDFANEIRKAREGRSDLRFANRLSADDADMILLAQEQGVPAAERRHASMIQFILKIESIERVLKSKKGDDSIIFLVSSLAGGTGTGVFLDFLLLLRKFLSSIHGTIISVHLLPYGFAKVKQNEDMNPLLANCYAAYREFLRLYYPRGNVKVHYSLSNLSLQNITKPQNVDTISDLVYIIDGSTVGGIEGSQIEYYRGIVPSVVSFIENSFLAINNEEATRTSTFFDNAKAHSTANFLNEKVKEIPYDAFSFASFGTYRLLFDTEAIKTEFAQRIALKIFSQEQFLAASWLPDTEFYVKNFLLAQSESTKFDKDIVHDCLTKLHQLENFATLRSLRARLEDQVKFPALDLGTLKLKGKISEIKKLIDQRENSRIGNPGDRYQAGRPSFWAVYNYYHKYYTENFQESIRKKVLEILNKNSGTDNYGAGNLFAAEEFINTLKSWYIKFLRGFPEQGQQSQFTMACSQADATEGTYEEWSRKTDEFYSNNQNKGKGGIFSNLRSDYLNMRIKLSDLKMRDTLRQLVNEIASNNLDYLTAIHKDLQEWIYTFENCQKTIQMALNNLLEVRNRKKSIVCDEYLTESQDEIEKKIFNLIINYSEWEKVKSTPTTVRANTLESRFKEVIDNIPHSRWSEFLEGFTWGFNLPDRNGTLPSDKHDEGALMCFVSADLPNFPARNEWENNEIIQSWNYNLIECYLTKYRLNNLDNFSAFQILMLRQDEPQRILDKLSYNSKYMLFLNDTKLNALKDQGYSSFPPEDHFIITSYFGYQENQPQLKNWITLFDSMMNVATQEAITKVDIKEKAHEIVFISSKYCLPASAMENLVNTEDVYRYRIEKKLPPPLHIFMGEKVASKYELKISNQFDSPYEKLHPRLISVMEDESLIRSFLFAKMFALITEEWRSDPETLAPRNYLKIGDMEFVGTDNRPCYFSDLMYGILYDADNTKRNDKLLQQLKSEVNEKLTKTPQADKRELIKKQIEEFNEKVNDANIPKQERDLYKVWLIMLNEMLP